MEEMRNPDVVALQSLCDSQGGFRAVAKRLGVNDQSLYQILAGVRLKSGRPKGIGPQLKEKLNAAYPAWNAQPLTSDGFPSKPSDMALKLAAAFDRIPKNDHIRQAKAFSAAFAAIEKVLSGDAPNQ